MKLSENLWCQSLFILGQKVKNHNKHIHHLKCQSKLSRFSWCSPLNIVRLMFKKLTMLLLPDTSNRPGSHRVRVTNMTDTLNGTPQMNFYKDLD